MRGLRSAAEVIALGLVLGAVAGCGSTSRPARDRVAPASEGTPSGSPAPDGSASGTPAVRWTPELGATWQWQLTGPIDTSITAEVFDIDGEDVPKSTVAELHATGARVICYVSAGSWEDWRSDAGEFPSEVIGRDLDGWPGEKWLDIRRLDVLLPLMKTRFERCREKGFDGIEPDNVDGYANNTGFPLSAEDQLAYNLAIAGLAREAGLAVGLKNDAEQAAELEPAFDFAVVEECVAYGECDAWLPFIRAGKPVFHAEYTGDPDEVCAATRSLGFSTIIKNIDLDAPRRSC